MSKEENLENDLPLGVEAPNDANLTKSASFNSSKISLLIVGVVVFLGVVAGVGFAVFAPEEKDDSFCSQFGISDIEVRALLEATIGIAAGGGEFSVLFDATVNPELQSLTCLPADAFSLPTDTTAVSFIECPLEVIHPEAFTADLENVISLELITTRLFSLPPLVFSQLGSLEKLTFEDANFFQLKGNILGDIQIKELSFFRSSNLFEIPDFLVNQTELEVLNLAETDIGSLRQESFGSVSNLRQVDTTESELERQRVSKAEIALALGVKEEIILGDISDLNSLCIIRGNENANDFETKGIIKDDVLIDIGQQIFGLPPRSNRRDHCLPANAFERLDVADLEAIESFTNGSFFIDQMNELHPDALRQDIFSGMTSFTLRDCFVSDFFLEGQFDKFTSLKHFEVSLSGGEAFDFFQTDIFGEDCTLTSARFDRVTGLRQIPVFLERCPLLEELEIVDCGSFRFLDPNALKNAQSLRKLTLTGSLILTFFNKAEIAQQLEISEDIIVI